MDGLQREGLNALKSEPDSYHLEADIVDEYQDIDILGDDERNPPRPTTPLGFNLFGDDEDVDLDSQTTESTPYSRIRSRSSHLHTFTSSHSMSPITSPRNPCDSVDITNMQDNDTTPTSQFSHTTPYLTNDSFLMSTSTTELPMDCSDDESECSDSDVSFTEEHDIELPPSSIPDLIHYTSEMNPKVLISTSLNNNTSTSHTNPSVDAGRSAKKSYTCLPSPLSPHAQATSRYLLHSARRTPVNHGLSKHALLHLKYFWAVREEVWCEYTNALRQEAAYAGIQVTDSSPLRFTSGCHSKPPPPLLPAVEKVPLPPMSIHPRWGDLRGLRDPYCAHMDRYFVGMPMWTILKALWMFDVHTATEGRMRSALKSHETLANLSDDDDSDGDEDLMEMSIFTGFSDDSDVTLVDTESEGSDGHDRESADITIETIEDVKQADEELEDYMLMEEIDLNSSSSSSSPLTPEKKAPTSTIPNYPRHLVWETSWYRRVELLIQLTRLDRERQEDGFDMGIHV